MKLTPFCPGCDAPSELKRYTTFFYFYCGKCKEDITKVKPMPYRFGLGCKVELLKNYLHFEILMPTGEFKTVSGIKYELDGELFKTLYSFEEGGQEYESRIKPI